MIRLCGQAGQAGTVAATLARPSPRRLVVTRVTSHTYSTLEAGQLGGYRPGRGELSATSRNFLIWPHTVSPYRAVGNITPR